MEANVHGMKTGSTTLDSESIEEATLLNHHFVKQLASNIRQNL
jgi:hypothetical protein